MTYWLIFQIILIHLCDWFVIENVAYYMQDY